MKDYFNRDPAPGSYSVSTQDTSMMSQAPSMSNRGYGNGFVSMNGRFNQLPIDRERDPDVIVGPGQYEAEKPQRHVKVPKLEARNGFNLPFNEKNPLNYVKPITVNIYFKQQIPGVGAYDPEKPMKNTPMHNHVFNSKVKRQEYVNKDNMLYPGPESYNLPYGFDLVEREKDIYTRQFRQPIPKKIVPVNLYNPHQEVEKEEINGPGPGKYNIPGSYDKVEKKEEEERQPILNYIPNGKIYTENNLDRFGQPILPRRPLDQVPGPGYYEEGKPSIFEADESARIKNCFIGQQPKTTFPEGINQKIPGPAYYEATLEPKKVSFLFNANQRWINS